MRRFGLIGSMTLSCALVACGSDSTTADGPVTNPDGKVFDAAVTPDAKVPDATTPDAGPTFSGTIGVHDVELLFTNATVNTAVGHGGQITISFSQDGSPTVEAVDMHGTFAGQNVPCNASYSEVTKINPAVNEGTVTLTVKHADNSAGVAIPPCTFQNKTYSCIAVNGTAGGAIALATSNAPKFLTFTDGGSNTFGAENIGRYLVITGTGTDAGKAFPISGADGSNKLGLVNAPGVGPIAVVPSYVIVAGAGPVPARSDVNGGSLNTPPDFLVAGDKVTVATTVAANLPAAYTATVTSGGASVLDDATVAILAAPLDLSGTNDVTLGLKPTTDVFYTTVVVIDTTDAATPGDNDLGTPVTHTGSLTCAQVSMNSVKLPKELLAVLGHMPGLTKMRISIFHDVPDLGAGRPANIVVGHGVIQFQTPAAQ